MLLFNDEQTRYEEKKNLKMKSVLLNYTALKKKKKKKKERKMLGHVLRLKKKKKKD